MFPPQSWIEALRKPSNRCIKSFLDGLFAAEAAHGPGTPEVAPRGLTRRPKALYLSSPIGLGHVRRDRAIVGLL